MTPWNRRLAAARRRMRLTQEQVAERVGIQRSTLAHYELGRRKPDTETAIRLARILGSTVETLFGGVSSRPRRRAARRMARREARPATDGAGQ